MSINDIKNIIYNEIGFERKQIEILKQENNRFGGLELVIFKVKKEGYILKPTADGSIFFDFYDLNKLQPAEAEANEAPAEVEAEAAPAE